MSKLNRLLALAVAVLVVACSDQTGPLVDGAAFAKQGVPASLVVPANTVQHGSLLQLRDRVVVDPTAMTR